MDSTVSAHILLTELERERSTPTAPISTIVGWGVQAPGNIGALVRLAANFGSRRVLFVESLGTKHNLRLIRKTAVDAASHVDWSFVTPAQFVNEWAPQWPLVGLETSRRSVDLRDARWPRDCALIVGGESRGLPAEAVALCQHMVHIPTCGPLHSLNVSHALAIALYRAASARQNPLPD